MLIVVGGLVASGKSSVARETALALAARHIEADAIRDEMLHIEPGQAAHEAAWQENLAPEITERIYQEMFDRARCALGDAAGSVVLDGCFALGSQRRAARAVAHEFRTPFLFVECRTSRAVLEQRLSARSAASGVRAAAWIELLDRVEQRWEPVCEFGVGESLRVDSARPLASIVEEVLARLPDRQPVSDACGAA